MKLLAAVLFCGPLLLVSACVHLATEEAPAAAPAGAAGMPLPGAPAATPPSAPEPTLRIASAPIEALRSPFFSPLEVTFQNPSGQWHQVRKVSISPERQLYGPAIETLVGERLRAWQLAAREAQVGKSELHPALDALVPEPPPKPELPQADAAKPDAAPDPAASAVPPNYLVANPFTVAPGLFTRKWVVLYSTAPDALLGQDLVLSYELENAKVERVLVKYPKPAPQKN